jgi:hypothetical protein
MTQGNLIPSHNIVLLLSPDLLVINKTFDLIFVCRSLPLSGGLQNPSKFHHVVSKDQIERNRV